LYKAIYTLCISSCAKLKITCPASIPSGIISALPAAVSQKLCPRIWLIPSRHCSAPPAASAATVERDAAPALARMDDLGVARCGECGAELLCNETGDMPDVCPECGRRLEYDSFIEPDGPDVDRYRTRSDNQQEAGTAAEAASEGRETALGTPEAMAGTDATEAAGGQQPPPQAGEIDLGRLYAGTRLEAMEQEEGKQPGGP